MVRIDARYVIPAPRETVWAYLTDPAREAEYGWALRDGGNVILERRANGVRFRGGRDPGEQKRGVLDGARRPFWSEFDGAFDPAAWRIDWRIVGGFEAGSAFSEQLLAHPEGTQVHVWGRMRLAGLDWDQRALAFLFRRKAASVIERNLCRDYKRLKEHILARRPGVAA